MKSMGIWVLVLSSSLALGAKDFNSWKASFLKRWGKREVPRAFMKKHLDAVVYEPKVVKIDRNQVTSSRKLNYHEWMKGWLDTTPNRIAQGKALLKEHKAILDKVEKKYNVDREAIIALWGVETLYGNRMGKYNAVQALSTLAYEGRRRKFFETQLFTALKILHKGHIDPKKFLGSWSGALGQPQFMPSSFTQLAVDFDGDKRKDIWNSIPDTLASIANYLKGARWKRGAEIGVLAYAPKDRLVKINRKSYGTPAKYNKIGLRTHDGKKITGKWKRRAAKVPHQEGPFVLRGPNYMSIMRWNNSSLFAALTITLMDEFKKG